VSENGENEKGYEPWDYAHISSVIGAAQGKGLKEKVAAENYFVPPSNEGIFIKITRNKRKDGREGFGNLGFVGNGRYHCAFNLIDYSC